MRRRAVEAAEGATGTRDSVGVELNDGLGGRLKKGHKVTISTRARS